MRRRLESLNNCTLGRRVGLHSTGNLASLTTILGDNYDERFRMRNDCGRTNRNKSPR